MAYSENGALPKDYIDEFSFDNHSLVVEDILLTGFSIGLVPFDLWNAPVFRLL